jgi:hypothetical protein
MGFKRLFYHHTEDESQRKFSTLKFLIFLLYLSAFVLAFLQFTEGNIPASVKDVWKDKTDIDIMENIPLSIYGQSALLIMVLIVLSIFYFFLTQDKPVKQSFNGLRTVITHSKERKRAFLIILLLVLVFLIYQSIIFLLFPEIFEEFVISVSYKAGKGFLIVWIVLQPLLVFSGLLLTFDTIAKDFPRPFKGYNRFNITIFILTILFVIGMAGIISSIFGVNFGDEVGENLPYIPLSGFSGIFYSLSGVSFMLIGVITLSTIISAIICYEIFLKFKRGKNELQERRMANFMLIFPFLIIYVLTNALPFAFSFSRGLQSLNDILDILSLIFVMFFAIFRVMAIRDTSKQVEINRDILRKPREWLDLIPAYCKVLIIFYLAFISFYTGLEANTIFTLSGAVSYFEEVQMLAGIGISFILILYVFWRYKPEIT